MMHQPMLYLLLAPFALMILILSTLFAIINHRSRRFTSLIFFLITTTSIILFNMLELHADTNNELLVFSRITYGLLALLPVTWIYFCLEYTRGGSLPHPFSYIAVFSVIPVMTIIIAWTNDSHGFLWREYHIVEEHELRVTKITEYGSWFWVHVIYSYTLFLSGTALVFKNFFATEGRKRNQGILSIIAVALPIACNLLYVFRLIPGIKRDFSSLVFAISGLLFMISIIRYRLFDTLPIEYKNVMDTISKSLILVDATGIIQDINEQALSIPGFSALIGKHISDSLGIQMAVVEDAALSNGATSFSLILSGEHEYICFAERIKFNSEDSGFSITLKQASPASLSFRMSRREQAVYTFLVEGLTTKEISEKLCISENTTKTHIRHIFEKLQVNNRKDLKGLTGQAPQGGRA